ncbi:hypothetical protein YPPY60_2139, partial [Yersinia pestis PY-60]
MLLSNA